MNKKKYKKYTGVLSDTNIQRKNKRSFKAVAYYTIQKEYVTVKIKVEFILREQEEKQFPKKLDFFFNEKSRKWKADFIEEYI